jgi:hypothetical protein
MCQELKSSKGDLKILLDSNALFIPSQLKIDIFNELKTLLNRNFKLILLSPVQQELKKIADTGSIKTCKQAVQALKMAEKIEVVEVNKKDYEHTDDIIVYYAKKWNCPVFTNDKKLKKKLKNINATVIYVRQKSYLEIEGRI